MDCSYIRHTAWVWIYAYILIYKCIQTDFKAFAWKHLRVVEKYTTFDPKPIINTARNPHNSLNTKAKKLSI